MGKRKTMFYNSIFLSNITLTEINKQIYKVAVLCITTCVKPQLIHGSKLKAMFTNIFKHGLSVFFSSMLFCRNLTRTLCQIVLIDSL